MKVVLVMAQTVDGIIARDASHLADWTSKADKKAFIEETKKHGVIIMGQTTFETIGRPLPGRLNLVLTLEPEKYADRTQTGTLEFFKGAPAEIMAMLEQRGYQSAVLGGGARTNSFFLKDNAVDEILITIEPKIFGAGMNFTEGESLDLNLRLLETNRLDDNVLQLRYEVIK